MDKNKLFVGNLPWSIDSQGLKNLFSEFGEITGAEVISDRISGRSKGFGFVTFAREEDARKAMTAMEGKKIEERNLVVNLARPREEREDRGGFGRNNRRGY